MEVGGERFFRTAKWWLPLAAVVSLFIGVGSGSLANWDEATYAQVAKEM